MLQKSGFFHKTSICSCVCSRALIWTFWGEWKNLCSSKFVQLELLNKAKARSSKKRAVLGFHYISLCKWVAQGVASELY